jgi:hypothetical protein
VPERATCFVKADLDSKYRPALEARLEGGEELRGLCIASQQRGMLRGGAAVIGITDGRLLVQSLTRRGDPDGKALAIAPGDVAAVKAGSAGGGWINASTVILDHAAVKLEIRTTGGERLKLMLMRGEGRALGGLGGGEPQRRGLEALAEWFRANDPS